MREYDMQWDEYAQRMLADIGTRANVFSVRVEKPIEFHEKVHNAVTGG